MHTCGPMPWCHGYTTGMPQVHHRYIMGTSWVPSSDLLVSTALFTITAHGPQQATSYLLSS